MRRFKLRQSTEGGLAFRPTVPLSSRLPRERPLADRRPSVRRSPVSLVL